VSPDYDLPFAGTIDEVAVYPTALSQSQVLAHYGAAYGPSLRPIISQQPAPTTNYVTLPAKMTVGAYGTIPLTYQWHKDGVDVPGATSSAYPIASLAPSDAGNYTVTITNPNGVTNSASAPLVVLAAPVTPPAIPGLVLHITCDGSLNDQTGRGNNGLSIHVVTNAAGGGFSSNAVAATYYPGNPVNPLGQSFHYSTDTSAEPGNLGIATNDFYMTLGHRTDLDFSSNVNFSVSLWIQFPANVFQGDLPYLCSAVGSYQNPGFTFAPSYNLGSWSYSLNGNVQLYGPDHAIDDGLFHNLVHTFDRNGLAVTYLDGHLVDSRSAVGIGDLDTGNFVNVGQDPTGFYPETGAYQVADLGVWRKVLTPLEAASIYMAATASQLSFTGAPIPPLTIQRVGNQVHLTWSVGTLQSADVVTGPYVNVTPVSPYNAPATAAKKFYRVKL
jgi:hypothetical protein